MIRENISVDPRVKLLKELADLVRLRVVDRLGHGGPASLSRLGAELDLALPLLSNHLRRLRAAGLVAVERQGRHAIYSLADPGLQALMPLLDRLTGRVAAGGGPPDRGRGPPRPGPHPPPGGPRAGLLSRAGRAGG